MYGVKHCDKVLMFYLQIIKSGVLESLTEEEKKLQEVRNSNFCAQLHVALDLSNLPVHIRTCILYRLQFRMHVDLLSNLHIHIRTCIHFRSIPSFFTASFHEG